MSPRTSISSRRFFMLCIKNHRPPAPSRLLSAKGHVRIFCSLVNAFATKISHYQPFAVKSVISTRVKEDSDRGSYTRQKPRRRRRFLCHSYKKQRRILPGTPRRRKSRPVRMFACRRTRDGPLSLPIIRRQIRYQHAYQRAPGRRILISLVEAESRRCAVFG